METIIYKLPRLVPSQLNLYTLSLGFFSYISVGLKLKSQGYVSTSRLDLKKNLLRLFKTNFGVIVVGLLLLIGLNAKGQDCEQVSEQLKRAKLRVGSIDQSFLDSLAKLETVFQQHRCLDQLNTWANTLFNLYSMKRQFRKGGDYYKKAYEIAKIAAVPEHQITVGMQYAESLLVLEQYGDSHDVYEELKDLEQADRAQKSRIYCGFGKALYFLERNLENALPYLEKSLEWARMEKDSVLMKNAHEAMAYMYFMDGALLAASKEYMQMDQYVPEDLYYPKLNIYYQLAQIFMELGDDVKTEFYGTKAYQMAEEQGYAKTVGRTQLLLARLASRRANPKADTLFQKVIQYIEDKPKSLLAFNTYYHYGRYLIDNDKISKAEAMLRELKSFPRSYSTLKPRYLPELEAELGLATKDLKRLKAAIDSLNQNAVFSNSLYDQLEVSKLKRAYFDLSGNVDSAYAYAMATLEASQNLFEEDKTRFIYDAESRYEKGKQDQKIIDLIEKQELSSLLLDMKKRQTALMWLGISALFFISVWIFYLYRKNNRKSIVLARKNALIKKTLSEKEILLKEIHHRVKNNLQVVSSLLSLQSRFIQDEQALSAITEGKNRVRSMALIHQNLYQENNLTGVAVQPYFEKLIRSLFDSYNIDRERIKLELEVDELTLAVDTVIPVGLITNELVSNALKHAFPEGRKGLLSVRVKEVGQQLVLEVSDNGIGIIDEEIIKDSNTFGYRIINAFKEKLEADLKIDHEHGTRIRLFIAQYEAPGEGVIAKVG